MKKLFAVYIEYQNVKDRIYFRATGYEALVDYLSAIYFGIFEVITQIKRLKRIYRKTYFIEEVI